MNNLKNLLVGLKVRIESLATDAFNMVIGSKDFMTELQAKSKLRDCIWRADNAYLALTGYLAPKKLITLRQLEEVVMYSDTFAKLKSNLENQCSANDAIYILLLSLSVVNVYKPKGTPVINGGIDIKCLK